MARITRMTEAADGRMNEELIHKIQERAVGLKSHRRLNFLPSLSVVSVQSVVTNGHEENHGWHG